jgi:hypothetical protein
LTNGTIEEDESIRRVQAKSVSNSAGGLRRRSAIPIHFSSSVQAISSPRRAVAAHEDSFETGRLSVGRHETSKFHTGSTLGDANERAARSSGDRFSPVECLATRARRAPDTQQMPVWFPFCRDLPLRLRNNTDGFAAGDAQRNASPPSDTRPAFSQPQQCRVLDACRIRGSSKRPSY